jgi:hypothetical protein
VSAFPIQNTLYSVESLIKNHENFERSVKAQEEKIEEMNQFASDLVEQKHYAKDEIQQRCQTVLARRDRMWNTANQRRKKLNDSRNYQLFLRNLYEVRWSFCLLSGYSVLRCSFATLV